MLKLQYFGPLMQTADHWKSPDAGKDCQQKEKKGHQRIKWMDTITDAIGINLGRLQEMATDSNILAWSIPWTEELVGCSP